MARPRVDLPQPDSPTSPTFSPGATVSETPSTAWTVLLGRAMSTRQVLDHQHRFAAAAPVHRSGSNAVPSSRAGPRAVTGAAGSRPGRRSSRHRPG